MKKTLLFIPLFLLNNLFGHCQIPCGIYDDVVRIVSIEEDISTILKSINKIEQLSTTKGKQSAQDYNQLVRWINNKETHAQKIQDVISGYFLSQRIKPVSSDDPGFSKYVNITTTCQKLIYYAMKCKQNVDVQYVEKLSAELESFMDVFLDKHGREHLRDMRH